MTLASPRQSGVEPRVIDALVDEGRDFAGDYGHRRQLSAGVTMDDPYSMYSDPNGFQW